LKTTVTSSCWGSSPARPVSCRCRSAGEAPGSDPFPSFGPDPGRPVDPTSMGSRQVLEAATARSGSRGDQVSSRRRGRPSPAGSMEWAAPRPWRRLVRRRRVWMSQTQPHCRAAAAGVVGSGWLVRCGTHASAPLPRSAWWRSTGANCGSGRRGPERVT
jgi:hypothetical protein